MTPGPDPQVNLQVVEQERRRLGQRLEEVSRLCEADVPPVVFYGEMLKRLLESLAAPAGAVWTRTPQGNLQIQYPGQPPADRPGPVRRGPPGARRAAAPGRRPGQADGRAAAQRRRRRPRKAKPPPATPPTILLLIVPILLNDQVTGLIEVWQQPNRPPAAVPGFKQYMHPHGRAGRALPARQMLRQMTGQEQLWTQLEAFARQIHGSLQPQSRSPSSSPTTAGRLIECDRVSVAVRYGGGVTIEAVSGADVVEKRSNAVRLMRKLCQRVLLWGEKLVFNGTRDDSLPPKVLKALDDYLAESPSKLLVVMPLKDEREKETKSKKPPRAAHRDGVLRAAGRAAAAPGPPRRGRQARHQRPLQRRRASPHPVPLRVDAAGQGPGRRRRPDQRHRHGLLRRPDPHHLHPVPGPLSAQGRIQRQAAAADALLRLRRRWPAASSISRWRRANRSARAAAWSKCTISRISDRRSSPCARTSRTSGVKSMRPTRRASRRRTSTRRSAPPMRRHAERQVAARGKKRRRWRRC